MDPFKKKEYVQSNSVTQAQQNLQQHQASKPGEYQSQYQKPMQDLFDKIQNRPAFNWDPKGDALYQQAVDNYVQQGQKAMMDTMGQATALTGGYGNSYAQGAGQNAYQAYLQQIGGMAGQYQQMALDRYRQAGDDLRDQYGMMMQMEGQQYDRYNDNLNRWLAEQDRLQGLADREYDRDYNSYWQNQNFDYNAYQDAQNQQYREDRDAVADKQWQDQWQHQMDREAIEDERWQKQWDEDKRRWEMEMAMRQEAASRGRGGGGRGSGSRSPSKSTENSRYISPGTNEYVAYIPATQAYVDRVTKGYGGPSNSSSPIGKAASKLERYMKGRR